MDLSLVLMILLFGGQDIDFEEDDQFSRKFVLQGKSEAEVRQPK